MSFSVDPRSFPRFRTYAQAAQHEVGIKPIRGLSPPCKPLGDRRKQHVNIRKESNGDIVIRMHSTDIITFKPDNTLLIYLNGWDTQSTIKVLNRVTCLHIWKHDKRVWVQSGASFGVGTSPDTGAYPLWLNKANEFTYVPSGYVETGENTARCYQAAHYVFTNPAYPTKITVNRKGMSAHMCTARAMTKDFTTYATALVALNDGRIPDSINTRWGNLIDFFALANRCPDDEQKQASNWVSALGMLKQELSSGRNWYRLGLAAERDRDAEATAALITKPVEKLLKHYVCSTYPDEVFTKELVTDGRVVDSKYSEYVRL